MCSWPMQIPTRGPISYPATVAARKSRPLIAASRSMTAKIGGSVTATTVNMAFVNAGPYQEFVSHSYATVNVSSGGTLNATNVNMSAIGWGYQTADGFRVDEPLLRGANADLNLTLAMALVFFACWIIWALQELGPRGFVKELFAPKGETTGLLKVLMVVVFAAVGCLEVISILFRPVSLSFRLYGNIFAGENMLDAMSKLVPGFGWLLPIPFYFLELLVGLVQALVFTLLTAVFTLLICQHEETSPKVLQETEA